MKAIIVPFQDLALGSLFIKAEDALNYVVFRKYDQLGALHPRSRLYISFSGKQPAIAVAETTFGELPQDHQLVFEDDARKMSGFEAPKDVYIKTKPGYVSYFGPAGPIGQFECTPDNTKVINLNHTFNVRMVPMAFLNVE